jgi:hypothetical protein
MPPLYYAIFIVRSLSWSTLPSLNMPRRYPTMGIFKGISTLEKRFSRPQPGRVTNQTHLGLGGGRGEGWY